MASRWRGRPRSQPDSPGTGGSEGRTGPVDQDLPAENPDVQAAYTEESEPSSTSFGDGSTAAGMVAGGRLTSENEDDLSPSTTPGSTASATTAADDGGSLPGNVVAADDTTELPVVRADHPWAAPTGEQPGHAAAPASPPDLVAEWADAPWPRAVAAVRGVWTRIWARRPRGWSLGVPLVLMLAGVLFAVSGMAARGTDLRSTVTGMPDLIRQHTRQNADLASKVAAVQAQVDALNKAQAPGNAKVKKLTAEGDAIAQEAGIVPVKGPGIEVSLDDSSLRPDQFPQGTPLDYLVVHQQDVQAVVNALWRGGAEAMMLMDQRVISTSAVRCVGNTLILKGRVYSPPFTITAIGDPGQLTTALQQDPQVAIYREYVVSYGLGYDVQLLPEVTVPAYAGTTSLDYAQVIRK